MIEEFDVEAMPWLKRVSYLLFGSSILVLFFGALTMGFFSAGTLPHGGGWWGGINSLAASIFCIWFLNSKRIRLFHAMLQAVFGIIVCTAALILEIMTANTWAGYLGSASVRANAAGGPVATNTNNIEVWCPSPSNRPAIAACAGNNYMRTPAYGDDDFAFNTNTCFLTSSATGE